MNRKYTLTDDTIRIGRSLANDTNCRTLVDEEIK